MAANLMVKYNSQDVRAVSLYVKGGQVSDESQDVEIEAALQEALTWAREQLQAGEAASAVFQEFVRQGWSPEAAERMVDWAVAAQQDRPPLLTRVASSIGGWGVIAVVYVLLNAVLWGGQEMMAVEKKREAVQLEQRLDALDVQINRMESRGRGVGLTESEEAQYRGLIDSYNRIVPEYNEVAKAAYSRWWLLPIPVPGGRKGGQGPIK